MADIIFGLDIGTTKICAVVGEVREGQLQIIGLGIAPSRGMRKGMVIDVGEASLALATAVEQAEQTSGYDLSQALVSMAGEHISSTNNTGVSSIGRNNHGVTADALKSVRHRPGHPPAPKIGKSCTSSRVVTKLMTRTGYTQP
ncbi:MAG: hypothetical protein HC804_07365 [Anaerolineae bacterium]|nr:hypothetical protein [Anaerolineae bacterium]